MLVLNKHWPYTSSFKEPKPRTILAYSKCVCISNGSRKDLRRIRWHFNRVVDAFKVRGIVGVGSSVGIASLGKQKSQVRLSSNTQFCRVFILLLCWHSVKLINVLESIQTLFRITLIRLSKTCLHARTILRLLQSYRLGYYSYFKNHSFTISWNRFCYCWPNGALATTLLLTKRCLTTWRGTCQISFKKVCGIFSSTWDNVSRIHLHR